MNDYDNAPNIRMNFKRAREERKARELIKGDLLVLCVALGAALTIIVMI